MRDPYSFAHCPFQIDYTESQVQAMLDELLSLDSDRWHFNSFRNCYMLSFFNPGGRLGQINLAVKDSFDFSEVADQCPTLRQFVLDQIIPFMEPLGRVTILRTPAGNKLPLHIDCAPSEVGTIQHKWRFVLQGEIEKLCFVDSELKNHPVSREHRCYVLDGGQVHHLELSDIEKITICVGSPWHGNLQDKKYTDRLLLDQALYVTRPVLRDEWVENHLLEK